MALTDIRSSDGAFINNERPSGEGLESKPFKLKSDDIVVSHFHPFLTISCISYIQHSLKQEFSIDTIIHHTVAACVLCALNNHDTQAAAHVEQQQPAQNPPSYALSSRHQNINSTTSPSNAFNLNGQEPGTEYNGFKRNIVD